MAGIGQYLKDTRGELRHVAWPTRTQTVVFTLLVALVSVGISLYLGLFDYIFTGALSRALGNISGQTPTTEVTEQPTTPAVQISTTTETPEGFKLQ